MRGCPGRALRAGSFRDPPRFYPRSAAKESCPARPRAPPARGNGAAADPGLHGPLPRLEIPARLASAPAACSARRHETETPPDPAPLRPRPPARRQPRRGGRTPAAAAPAGPRRPARRRRARPARRPRRRRGALRHARRRRRDPRRARRPARGRPRRRGRRPRRAGGPPPRRRRGLRQPRHAGDAAGRDRDRDDPAPGRRRPRLHRPRPPRRRPALRPARRRPAARGAPRRGARRPGPGPGRGRHRAGRRRQHRLEPRDRAARAALRLPAEARRPRAAARASGRRRADILAELWRHGRAAGNRGDLYDNRDRGHSPARPRRASRSSPSSPMPPPPAPPTSTTGSTTSLALRPPDLRQLLDRDHRRRALAQPAALRDDPGRRHRPAPALAERRERTSSTSIPRTRTTTPKNGDLFPANTPYLLVSPRLLGLGQALPRGAGADLAAFRPDTKARLVPRACWSRPCRWSSAARCRTSPRARTTSSGAAHPAAFEGFEINPARMVSLANSIKADAIPPRVRIQVTAEDLGTEGRDYFGEGLSEQLFDTPSAPSPASGARSAARRTMQVSAAATRDPNGRPLGFEWRLLQGDPAAGQDRARRGRRQRAGSPSTGTSPSASPTTTRSPPPASTSASSPTTASTTAPRRSSAGTSPPRRRAATPDRPRRRRCASPASTTPPADRRLRRPDADPARRLARRLPLRRRRQPHRLDPHPRRSPRRRRLRRERRPHPGPGHRRPPRPRPKPSPTRSAAAPTAASASRRSPPRLP